jgi:ribosomal protein S18 acetylase RimI-like enzyme
MALRGTSWRGVAVDGGSDTAALVDWIHEAGNPYYDWLFDGPATARSALTSCVCSATSEISAELVTTLVDATGRMLGGYVGLDGAELQHRRQQDTLAFLRAVPQHDRPGLMRRMRAGRALFPPVAAEDQYLSKIGVRPDARGMGVGRYLVERFIELAASDGRQRVRLDVHAANTPAVTLYRSIGFRVVRESRSDEAEMSYLAMELTTAG